jgi:FkbM family methyltransferase
MTTYYDEADHIFDEAYAHAADYRLLDLRRMVRDNHEMRVCAFGTGKVFLDNFHLLERDFNCKISFACDNDPRKWGKTLLGVSCLSPNELRSMTESVLIIITAIEQWVPIAQQLKQDGFKYVFPLWRWIYGNSEKFDSSDWLINAKPKFKQMLDILHDDFSRRVAVTVLRNRLARDMTQIDYSSILRPGIEYFPDDIFTLGRSECFVDGGAYTGDTLLSFLKECNNSFEHYYLFELDERNYKLLQSNVAGLPEDIRSRITVYPFGIWDKNQSVSFSGDGISSTISNRPEATFSGHVKRLDEVLTGEKVTMIKMDIEGAEVNALKGAATIIKCQRPKLAICAYHRLEHLWDIPLLIKEMYSDYEVHLRHYTSMEFGSNVCYAVVPN